MHEKPKSPKNRKLRVLKNRRNKLRLVAANLRHQTKTRSMKIKNTLRKIEREIRRIDSD
jgi:hypothetical protein